jgi:hypothetical protein
MFGLLLEKKKPNYILILANTKLLRIKISLLTFNSIIPQFIPLSDWEQSTRVRDVSVMQDWNGRIKLILIFYLELK